MSSEPDYRWSLTPRALDRLLNRLGAEPEAAAREYEFLRRRLITFFALQGIDAPEDVTDQAFDRVARRLDEGETVVHVRAYFHGVAQRVVSELRRQRVRERAAIEVHRAALAGEGGHARTEARVACLERCLRALPDQDRALLHEYYDRTGGPLRELRKGLARKLGIGYSNLKVRTYRIRRRVEACMGECLSARERGDHDLE